MATLRAVFILAAFFTLTLPLIPVQLVLLKFAPHLARMLPHWYHRQVCRLLGIRLTIKGGVTPDKAVLFVSNHTSWLDIPVLSALAPVSFISKKEVATWPFVSWLAKLQRSIFIDRDKRRDVGRTMTVMLERLAMGDNIVLFPEGTSSDGNRVLNFQTSLFAAAKPPERFAGTVTDEIDVQTVAIVYRHLHGLPLTRAERKLISWYGDMDMLSHAWNFLKAGPLDVEVTIGAPRPLDDFADRKDLARQTEHEVRAHVMRQLRGLQPDAALAVTEPAAEVRRPAPIGGDADHGAGMPDKKPKKWR